MAKVIEQNIPPEYLWGFSSVIRVREYPPDETGVGLRYPWRIRNSQGCRTVRPPILRGPDVSAWQCAHRIIFGKCVKCFNKQPDEGGVEPPELGYRNRSWWYTDAGGSGLWYYTYFIKQTIIKYLTGVTPLWCMKICDYNARTTDQSVRLVNCNDADISVAGQSYGQYRGYVYRQELDGTTLNLYYSNISAFPFEPPYTVKIYEVDLPISCSQLNWLTQPPLGAYLGSITDLASAYGWRNINVGNVKGICLTTDMDCRISFRGKVYQGGKYGPAFS